MPFRQLVPPTSDSNEIHPDLKHHLDAVAAHWPGLRTALDHELLTFSSYEAGFHDGKAVFAVLVEAAEDVRHRRRAHGDHASALIAIHTPGMDDIAEYILDVPHSVAATLYARTGLVIHQAVKGDTHDRDTIPPVPLPFFLIRPRAPQDWPILDDDQGPSKAIDDGRDMLPPGPPHIHYVKLLHFASAKTHDIGGNIW